MRTPRIVEAMNYIDDDLVSWAVEYMPQRTNRRKWLKLGAIAALFCCVIAVCPYVLQDFKEPIANDNEPYTKINMDEIGICEPFSVYFPTKIAKGYTLDTEIMVYDGELLEAVYVNDNTDDTLIIRVAPQSRFNGVDTGIILYRTDKGDGKSSYLYVDCGDYIVYYSSAKCDLKELDGFDAMVNSSSYIENIVQ